MLTERGRRCPLDLAVGNGVVGATVDAGNRADEFGLRHFTRTKPKVSWLRAGSGQFQFKSLRDRVMNLNLTNDEGYEALFGEIRLRLAGGAAYLVGGQFGGAARFRIRLGRGVVLLVRSSHRLDDEHLA